MAILEAEVRQTTGIGIGGESDEIGLTSTKLGQLFTASWREKLRLAGKCWRITPGAFPANSDITQVTGGGNGTILDLEQPEIVVGVDGGYYLIPIEIDVSTQSDTDTNLDYMRIVAIIDRTTAVPTSLTGTIETPANLLDGGDAFPGRAYSAVTADIADPTMDELIAFRQRSTHLMDATGTYTTIAKAHLRYEPKVPSIAKGPCGLYIYWGGAVATTGLASVVVAAVPASWIED